MPGLRVASPLGIESVFACAFLALLFIKAQRKPAVPPPKDWAVQWALAAALTLSDCAVLHAATSVASRS